MMAGDILVLLLPEKIVSEVKEKLISDTTDRDAVRACTAEIMRAITALVEQLRGEKAPRPYDMKYDGNPGKGRIGVRRPDLPPDGEGAPASGAAADGGLVAGSVSDDGSVAGSGGESGAES